MLFASYVCQFEFDNKVVNGHLCDCLYICYNLFLFFSNGLEYFFPHKCNKTFCACNSNDADSIMSRHFQNNPNITSIQGKQ